MLMVEMTAEYFRSHSHRLHETGYKTWDFYQTIGKAYGWKPEGTIADLEYGKHWLSTEEPNRDPRQRQDYGCEDMYWSKIVVATDAYKWATALISFIEDLKSGKVAVHPAGIKGPTILSETMTPEQMKSLNNPNLLEETDKFIRFLLKGQFRFCWDD